VNQQKTQRRLSTQMDLISLLKSFLVVTFFISIVFVLGSNVNRIVPHG